MAKTVKTVETFTDDLDGSAAVRTVRLGYDSGEFELDLSAKNLKALESALKPYLAVARKVSTSPSKKRDPARVRRAPLDRAAIMEWATKQGIEISPRGRIANAVLEQYHAAQ